MLFRKLNKLYKLRTKLYTSLVMTRNSDANPELIDIRTNDLEQNIEKISKEIKFEELMRPFIYIIWGFIGVIIFILLSFMTAPETHVVYRKVVEQKEPIVTSESSVFSKEELITYVKSLNLKFPHIILAQAQLESGNFSSRIFKENNNFFGMKQARSRPTTCIKLQHGHAYYNNWKDCVIDYALYQAAYLKKIKTEEQYYNYIGANYAESPNYESVVRDIAKSYK